MTEEQVYQFYNEKVKIAYSEIEARGNSLPVELLFEIHSAFDHLKRYHLNEDNKENACNKAYAHLKRGTLDAYKLKLKYYNNEFDEMFNSNSELKIIDSGKFFPDALSLNKQIVEIAQRARLKESSRDTDEAFEDWYKTSLLIDQFQETFFDSEKLRWAEKQGWKKTRKEYIFGIVTGVIGSIIVAGLLELISFITQYI